MTPPDSPDEDRAKYHRALIDGPQPSAGPSAQSPVESHDDLPGGTGINLPDTGAALGARPPDDIAELIVYEKGNPDTEPHFGLKVACSCQDMRVVDLGVTYDKPDLDPARNLMPGGPQPTTFLGRMDKWSYDRTELADWLNLHRARHHDGFQLVIWDNTPHHIPWELFWLPPPEESALPGDCLGALLAVSRWLRVKSYRSQSLQSLASPVPQARGSVAAYVDPGMNHDRDLLRDYEVNYATSMGELFAALAAADLGPLAMVYVAAHGVPGGETADFTLGGYRLGLTPRLNDNLRRVRDPAAFVFLNGCNTGVLDSSVRMYRDRSPRGFAVVFLRSGAAGVLATTGEVGNAAANKLAGKLFGHFRADRGTSVAEALRRVRAEAAEAITRLLAANSEGREVDRELISQLYPFMYVYFGNPRTLVAIDANGASPDTDERDG